jgi:hypothetical protein
VPDRLETRRDEARRLRDARLGGVPTQGGADRGHVLGRRGEHLGDTPFCRVDPPLELAEAVLEPIGVAEQRVGVAVGRARRAEACPEVAQRARRQLAAQRARRDVDDGVALVEDHDVVVREHPPARREVRQVQRVVHDEHRRAVGAHAGLLGEALVALGAARRARALVRATADGAPSGRGHAVDPGRVPDVGLGGVAL